MFFIRICSLLSRELKQTERREIHAASGWKSDSNPAPPNSPRPACTVGHHLWSWCFLLYCAGFVRQQREENAAQNSRPTTAYIQWVRPAFMTKKKPKTWRKQWKILRNHCRRVKLCCSLLCFFMLTSTGRVINISHGIRISRIFKIKGLKSGHLLF